MLLRHLKTLKVLLKRCMDMLSSVLKQIWREYNSSTFNEFRSSNGIKRQLTTTYTPQQNVLYEINNRTPMNMVRSMLSARDVPKRFCPKAIV
jgi:hypothetical protein